MLIYKNVHWFIHAGEYAAAVTWACSCCAHHSSLIWCQSDPSATCVCGMTIPPMVSSFFIAHGFFLFFIFHACRLIILITTALALFMSIRAFTYMLKYTEMHSILAHTRAPHMHAHSRMYTDSFMREYAASVTWACSCCSQHASLIWCQSDPSATCVCGMSSPHNVYICS